MINTEKINFNTLNSDGMTRDEVVEKIIARTGVTKEQAEEAAEKSNGELLDAMIYAEKHYGQASKGGTVQPVISVAEKKSEQPNYKNPTGMPDTPVYKAPQPTKPGFFEKIGRALINNSIVISTSRKRVMSIPLIVAILLGLSIGSAVLVAVVISMFCGIRYSFEGESKQNSEFNHASDSVYSAVQTVKSAFSDSNTNSNRYV